MMMRLISFLFLISLCSFTKSYIKPFGDYPKDFFRSPVLHPIEITGTFGELRNNHFHGGIDIRPDKSGVSEPIVAAADGYVSRIQVSAYGYGKLLQITHNNGFTTLYAHLDNFTPEINEYVKSNQYAQESFEVNLFPKAGTFFFQKGQQIGMMGNTGGSQGTHLHFEIREIGSDHPLNPLLFGFDVPDDKSPKFYEMKVYSLDENHQTITSREINLRAKGTKKKIKVKKGKKTKYKTIYIPPPADSPYTIEGDTIEVSADKVGFGIKTYDTANWSGNTNGIYDLSLYQNENLVFNFNVERFEFTETRYINAHIDYKEKSNGGGLFNRCYRMPGNQLSMYKNLQNDGVVYLDNEEVKEIMIIAKDAHENPDSLTFYIKKINNNNLPKTNNSTNQLSYNIDNTFENGNFSAFVPNGCLYESCPANFSQSNNNLPLSFSPIYKFHTSSTPLHKSIEIKIKPEKLVPDSLSSKLFIAYKENDGDLLFCGNQWIGEYMEGKNDTFGSYCMMADTVAPYIKPIQFSENMQTSNRMSFKISDNIKTKKGGLKWRATIDGQWILLEHDVKSPILTHRFDEKVAPGSHELVVEAEDMCGNKSIFRKTFIR